MVEPRPCKNQDDWWADAFDDRYPLLYRHRDEREARQLLEQIARIGSLGEGRLLDLGCGTGRHLRALHEQGVRGIGLDYSWPLLRRARESGCTDSLVRADMRRLPFRSGSFGWVLMMFTTFGYFVSDEENRRLLESVAGLLRPGGRLVLDYLNANTLRASLVERSHRAIPGYRVEERRWIDASGPFVRKETRLEPTGSGNPRLYRERVRLYEPRELERMLAAVGFTSAARLGDYDGRAFDEEVSPRLICVAQVGRRKR
jgi:SAM-dependent methyltransferase